MNPRYFLIFILLLIFCFSLVTSCSTTRGRIKQGRGGEIQSADIIAYCKEPRKTYAKEIEASLKAEIDKLRKIPDARLEAELRNKVIRLSDYSTKGLDLDLMLFRICEMSLNRGFTNDQTSHLIEIAIEAWSEKQKEEPRKLSRKDENELLKLLKTNFPEKSINLGYISGDTEAQNFANQIFRLLGSTNFLEKKILNANLMATGGAPPTGIIFLVSNPDNVSYRDKELYNFFYQRDLSPNFMKATPRKAIEIIIAPKP